METTTILTRGDTQLGNCAAWHMPFCVAARGRPFGSPAGSRSSSLSSYRRRAFFVGAAPNPPINRTASGSRLSATLGIARLRIQMQSSRGAHSLRCWATAGRAARPASLASSARTEVLEAIALQSSARAARPMASGALPELLAGSICRRSLVFREACLSKFFHSRSAEEFRLVGRAEHIKRSMFGKAEVKSLQTQALRRSAKPKTGGRAGTRCCAARAGGVHLLASVVTQRAIRAGSGVLRPLPNPSIERTCPGRPGHASHLKR